MPRFSVKAWCRAVTVLGGVLAVVAMLALIISVVSNVQGNPAAAAPATAPTAFLILTVMMIIGAGLMLVSAIVQRNQGHRLRLWMLGLDALFQSFAGRYKRRNANLELDRSAEDSPTSPEDDGHARVKTVPAPTAPPAGGAVRGSPTPPPPDPHETYHPKYVPLWNNVISYFGLFLIAMAILLLLTFSLFTAVTRQANPYVDIVGYLVLPGILVLGSLIVPVGMFFKSWRLRRRDPLQKLSFLFPRIDLNDPVQRRAAKVVVGGTFLMLPVVVVSSYHGYHYSDSADFCAKACHKVMEPQATTYEHSAHARVACAECHIGEGASWFVKAKLSGTRQVLATIQESFPRPIPPAITNLRPARETCERCHWPKKFFGAQLREIVHFSADENNTRRELDMLLKTGGGDESIGRAEGIHMHMALEGRLEYVATDVKVQDIPWVRYTDRAGNVSIYRSDGRPSSDPIPGGAVRQLDCMDCHNRPAHNFRSPEEAVDIFLDVGRIDTTLPFIKREAVAVLTKPYPDRETAEARIGAYLMQFYETQYPELTVARRASIHQAVDMVRQIYRQNFFPAMNVDWQTYPDNIGHKISPGCFRCHEGRHVNQNGAPISHACDICHTFLNPLERSGTAVIQEGEFRHPMTLEGVHTTLRCDLCHTGGAAPSPTCAGCHSLQSGFRVGNVPALQSFKLAPDPMAEAVDCEGCHDLSRPRTVEVINEKCLDCHSDDEARYKEMLHSWKTEIDAMLLEVESFRDRETVEVLRTLRKAGPLHNIEATRIITRAILGRSTAAPAGRKTTGD